MSFFRVLTYSETNLNSVFFDSRFPDRLIQNKRHITYLKSYFSIVIPQTILVEEEYIDKDHLEDYSFYYVKSFHHYDRICKRVHFFDVSFTEDDLHAFLQGTSGSLNKELLKSHYIGFIVIKPLPQTYIGRSCLRTYPSDGTRMFPPVRRFTSHLFGIELSVDSIPYQEQDSVVAACASIALWSCLQSTGYKFHHYIPSPAEITKCASEYFPFLPRHFPNHGLTFEQIALSFRKYNLEPYLVRISNILVLKYAVYSYIRAQLPIIMGFELYNSGNVSLGLHAVTILGVNTNQSQQCSLQAEAIDKIYVHDDQVGPFARMEFNGSNRLSTSWGGNCEAEPRFLAIPLTSKIRIDFIQVYKVCIDLKNLLDSVLKYPGTTPTLKAPLTFECHLSSINEMKQLVLENTGIDSVDRSDFLQRNHPKHIWRIAIVSGDKWFEIGLDATDIDQGDFFSFSLTNSVLFRDYFKLCDKIAQAKPDIVKSQHTTGILRKLIS